MFFQRGFNYFFTMLLAKERRGFIWLLLLAITGMLIDTLTIGCIVPLVTLLLHRGAIPENSPRWERLAEILHYPSRETLLMLAAAAVLGAFAGKNLFSYFRVWQQAKYFTALEQRLTTHLFTHYLRLPYITHLQRNSAELNSHLNEIPGLINALGVSFMILAESLALGGIFALLLYVEFWGTLTVSALVGGMLLIFNFTLRKKIAQLGSQRFTHATAKNRESIQGLNGIKEIKLLGRENFFLARYAAHSDRQIAAAAHYQALLSLPALLLEILAIASLAALTTVMIWQQKIALVATLGLYAGAMFRLLPAINRIINNLQAVQFVAAMVKKISEEIQAAGNAGGETATENLSPLPLERAIIFRGVSFAYPQRDCPAIREISLEIPAKAAIGFIGGSGAGKSTLVDLLVGLLSPDTGEILIDDAELAHHGTARRWQKQIGYVPQFIYLTDDTLRRNIAFGLADDEINEAAVKQAATAAQLDTLIAELPEGLDTVIGERGARLSGGQRQRIGIARALYGTPAVLVLDEATSALDLETEREIVEAIQSLHGKITTICVAHRFNTVARCDKIFCLEKGEISSAGTPAEFGIFPAAALTNFITRD